jgi:hypothetical protein
MIRDGEPELQAGIILAEPENASYNVIYSSGSDSNHDVHHGLVFFTSDI